MKQTTADEIRKFVNRTYIEPARKAGLKQVEVRSGAVHTRMKLVSRLPQVCGAIGADKFCSTFQVKRLQRVGPEQGGNLLFTFEVLP